MRREIYGFEDIGDDLPRPPLAALRAFFTSGVIPSPRGWSALAPEPRRDLVALGAAPVVDAEAVHAAVRAVPVNELRMIPKQPDPDPSAVPEALAAALGPRLRLTDGTWAGLRALDRFVLSRVAGNGRLLLRALREMLPSDPQFGEAPTARIAHATVTMRPDRLEKLRSVSFLDGRAFVLARVAGVRAARRAQETFDLRADRATGPIELDWSPLDRPGAVVWQAHVSAWDGSFSPAASLAAVAIAAIALADIVGDDDVVVGDARLLDEPWFGGPDAESQEAATAVLAKGSRGPSATVRMAPAPRPAAPAPVAPPAASPPVGGPAAPPPPPPRTDLASSRALVNALLGGLSLVVLALVAVVAMLLARGP